MKTFRHLPLVIGPLLFLTAPATLAQGGSCPNPDRVNRPFRTVQGEKALFVRIKLTEKNAIISDSALDQLVADTATLATNNSYGVWTLDFNTTSPVAGRAPGWIEIDLGSENPYAKANSPLDDGEAQITLLNDAVDAIQGLGGQPGDPLTVAFDDIERISFFTPIPTGRNWNTVSTGRYGFHVTTKGGPALVMHEWGHTQQFSHANSYDVTDLVTYTTVPGSGGSNYFALFGDPVSAVQYGDPFCTMGLGRVKGTGALVGRVDPSVPAGFFDSITNVHLNPVRKMQRGWICELDVKHVSASRNYMLNGIFQPVGSLPHALEIHRDVNVFTPPGSFFPTPESRVLNSIFVYWRDNEPNANDGLSIALGSRETAAANTRVFEFSDSPTQALETMYTTLKQGQTFFDGTSQTIIQFLGFVEGTPLVSIDFPNGVYSHPAVPEFSLTIEDVSDPEKPKPITGGEFLDDEFLRISVRPRIAGGPDWAGILRVELVFSYGEANQAVVLDTKTLTPPGSGGPANWILDLSTIGTSPIKRVCKVSAKVIAEAIGGGDGERNTGTLTMLLNQQ